MITKPFSMRATLYILHITTDTSSNQKKLVLCINSNSSVNSCIQVDLLSLKKSLQDKGITSTAGLKSKLLPQNS